MKIALASVHAEYALKDELAAWLCGAAVGDHTAVAAASHC